MERCSKATRTSVSTPWPGGPERLSSGTPLICDSPSSSAARTPLNSPDGSSATSHLPSATISARPSSTTLSAMRRSCASSPLVASSSSTTTSAKSKIGRASCRERVCQYVSISVVAVSLKQQRPKNDEHSKQHEYKTKKEQ